MFVSNKPAQYSFSEKRRKKVKRYTCMNTNCIETTLNFLTMRVICVPIYIECNTVNFLLTHGSKTGESVRASNHTDSIKFPANLVM